jgi:hypothetical protein
MTLNKKAQEFRDTVVVTLSSRPRPPKIAACQGLSLIIGPKTIVSEERGSRLNGLLPFGNRTHLAAIRVARRACGGWHPYAEGLVADGKGMLAARSGLLRVAGENETAEEQSYGEGTNGDLHGFSS